MKQSYFSIVTIKICRLFFFFFTKLFKEVVLREEQGQYSQGTSVIWLPSQTTGDEGKKLMRGLPLPHSDFSWAMQSKLQSWGTARETCLQQPSRQPPARAGQLVVAADMARTGQTQDQSCWHTASHFWQPLTLLGLGRGNSIWKQIWPKVFPFNSSACGFWRIKKNPHRTKLVLVLSGLIKCFITCL